MKRALRIRFVGGFLPVSFSENLFLLIRSERITIIWAPMYWFQYPYLFIRSSGFLNSAFGQRLFRLAYRRYKRFEDPFFLLTKREPRLFFGGDVIDVGANVGYTATVFADAIDNGRRVVAVEPDRWNFAMLLAEVKARHLEAKVLPIRAAIGERDGEALLWCNPTHGADHRIVTPHFSPSFEGKQEFVSLQRLDTLMEERKLSPIFIKVDVQGYEEQVLRGAENILRSNQSLAIALEIGPTELGELGFSLESLLGYLQPFNFTPSLLERNGSRRSIRWDAIAELSKHSPYINILLQR